MSQAGSSTVINRVGRVAVPVSDQDRAIQFYVDKLGFTLDSDTPFGEDDSYRWVEVSPPAGGPPLAIVPPRPGGPIGIDTNIILTTDDIDGAHAELRSRGVDIDDEVSRMGGGVPPMTWFRDQDNNALLLVEDPAEQ
jgi:catechol 2,3-dioxygenase-like lactoylglutathione lyase family enzyme